MYSYTCRCTLHTIAQEDLAVLDWLAKYVVTGMEKETAEEEITMIGYDRCIGRIYLYGTYSRELEAVVHRDRMCMGRLKNVEYTVFQATLITLVYVCIT